MSPALQAHAERQAQLAVLLRAHVRDDYAVACELLTRTSLIDDFAPDASVYPAAPHPVTGKRQLEQLAFEVVSKQSIKVSSRKAAKLQARGVRRVFAIDVRRARVLEWSVKSKGWRKLEDAHIEDPALDVPLPVAALVHTIVGNDEVARALLAKRNPVLERTLAERGKKGRAVGRKAGRAEGRKVGRAEGREVGRAEGKREALIVLLGARGIAVNSTARARINEQRDPARLDRWISRAASCTSIAQLLAEP